MLRRVEGISCSSWVVPSLTTKSKNGTACWVMTRGSYTAISAPEMRTGEMLMAEMVAVSAEWLLEMVTASRDIVARKQVNI